MQMLDDPQHRVAGEAVMGLAGAEQRGVAAVGESVHRQRGERDQRQRRVDGEHGHDHRPDRAGDRPRLVAGLLGHVGDRLDPRVGDHPNRDRDQEVLPRRRDPEVDVVDQHVRREDEHDTDDHQQQLRCEVGDRQHDVQPGRLFHADHVDQRERRHDADAEEDVARSVLQRRPEQTAQVVRHEERRYCDRDRVVEHLRPCGEERPQLVERVARKARRATRLGEHRGRLRVGGGREIEDHPRDHEHDRRQAERIGGDEAERVVDRGADVPVGGREQRARAENAAQSVLAEAGHSRSLYRGPPVHDGRRVARPAT